MRTNEQWVDEISRTVIVELCRQINRELKPITDRLDALERRIESQRAFAEVSER